MNTRRVDVSDYDLGEGTVPTVIYNDLAQFTYGAAYTASQTFPVALKERVALWQSRALRDGYVQAVIEGDVDRRLRADAGIPTRRISSVCLRGLLARSWT